LKKSKIQPSVLTLNFVTPTVAAGAIGNTTIDLSQVASLANRRFYRQGLNWAVAGFKIYTGAGVSGQVFCQKLPNTWVMSNAWEKSFRVWKRMTDDALEENESARPRFMDFKVYMDETHHAAGSSANLKPFNVNPDGTQNTAVEGDWDYSTIHVPDTGNFAGLTRVVNEFDLIATGDSYPGVSPATTNDAVSLIEGYASSRALPEKLDPNTPGDMESVDGAQPLNWMTAIFNEGLIQDAEILDDIREQNTIAPYPFENDPTIPDTHYPGGANQLPGLESHDAALISGTTIGGMSYLKGGNFPCGLIRFIWANGPDSTTSGISIQVDLVPGNHRGYLCEPMTEM
jgi:hypothetical protein